MKAAVFGNVTLDIICRTVDEVPRHHSIAFDQVLISPGGCASNVAIGLCSLGIQTLIICHLGKDEAADLVRTKWNKFNLDQKFVKQIPGKNTAVSVGLVDSDAQPRFIHTPGANATLSSSDLVVFDLIDEKVKILHIAGFFVLPGLLDGLLPDKLRQARQAEIFTCLDVVYSPKFWNVDFLWPCLPEIDVFFCNKKEAEMITGQREHESAAKYLMNRGARTIIIKLGDQGCYLKSEGLEILIPAVKTSVIDTTGAGDAFAAGFISTWLKGKSLQEACKAANNAGAITVAASGAIGAWDQ